MKQLAVIQYIIMFDPSSTWARGSQFEAQFSDFFAAHGYDCEIVAPNGGSGSRVIMLNNIDSLSTVKEQKNQQSSFKPKNPLQTLKTMQPDAPTKGFKTFVKQNTVGKQPQKLNYQTGRPNASRVGALPSVKFRGSK